MKEWRVESGDKERFARLGIAPCKVQAQFAEGWQYFSIVLHGRFEKRPNGARGIKSRRRKPTP